MTDLHKIEVHLCNIFLKQYKTGADPGFLDRGYKFKRGVRFVDCT